MLINISRIEEQKEEICNVQSQKGQPLEQEAYYLITFLNRISRVFLAPDTENPLDAIIQLCVEHYEIKMSKIGFVGLLSSQSKAMLSRSEELEDEEMYYLVFRHLTSDSEDIDQQDQRIKNNQMNFMFHFDPARSFKIKSMKFYEQGRVQDIKLERATLPIPDLCCPFLDCGKLFKRSCDQVTHFLVETGCKPFQCSRCGQEFRRKVLLNKHKIENKCALIQNQVPAYSPKEESQSTHSKSACKPFSCNQCGKINENSLEQLMQHVISYRKKLICRCQNDYYTSEASPLMNERVSSSQFIQKKSSDQVYQNMTAIKLYSFKNTLDDPNTVKRLEMMMCLQVLKTSFLLEGLGARLDGKSPSLSDCSEVN